MDSEGKRLQTYLYLNAGEINPVYLDWILDDGDEPLEVFVRDNHPDVWFMYQAWKAVRDGQ
jgi:hypothetical protein